MNELTNKFWNEHFRNKDASQLHGMKLSIYDWLNKDNFGGFGIDTNIFWIEKTCSLSRLPNYIYYYILKWAKRKGYTYLYELKEREG